MDSTEVTPISNSKSNVNCCVPTCKSIRRNKPDLIYHGLPRKGTIVKILDSSTGAIQYWDRKELWQTLLGIPSRSRSGYHRVCSLHFHDSDYIQSGWSTRKRLSPKALPISTLNITLPSHKRRIRRRRKWRKRTRDVEVQTGSDYIVKSDKHLKQLTGVPSLQLFRMLVSLLRTIDNTTGPLSLCNRLFLSLVKMKLDLPYVVLSDLFGLSAPACQEIFNRTIPALASVLKSVESVVTGTPKCFKNFDNVRVVLDCLEVPCEDDTTIRFMTAVSPSGQIMFISKGYRLSGTDIFEHSGLVNELTGFEDAVMTDNGFVIEELCAKFGVKVIKPSVASNKINSARVHIERLVNRRIRLFRILCNGLSVDLVPMVNSIFAVACGITNLSYPVITM